MSTFIRDLNRLRNAGNAGKAEQAGEVGGVDGDKAKVEGGVTPGKEPELRGGQGKPVAKKAQGLSGAALRTTIGDLFGVLEKLGIPGPSVAKYAPGMDQLVASLKDSAQRIDRAIAQMEPAGRENAKGLAAQLVLAMGKGLSGLDQTSAGVQIKSIIEGAAEMLESPRKPNGAQLRALERFAFATAQLGVADPAAELKRGAKSILSKNDAASITAAINTLDANMAVLVAGSDLATRAPLFRAALETVILAAHDAAKPADDIAAQSIAAAKAQLTDGQRQMLVDLTNTTRQAKGELEQQNAQLQLQIDGLRQQYQQQLDGPSQAKLAPLAQVRERAEAQLSPYGQSLWYGQVNAFVGHDANAVSAIARVELELLEHAGAAPPTPDLANQISQTLIALSQQPGVTPEAMAKLAEDHVRSQPAERLPGTLAILNNLLGLLRAQNVQLQHPSELATLANALIGRTDAYAAANGPGATLVDAIVRAPDENARKQALTNGARFAHAIGSAEPGPARDHLQASFATDLAALSARKIDLGALAAAYKTLPEDGLAHFAAIGLARGLDLDKWMETLSAVVKHARGNKEHIRALRNFVTLGDKNGADVVKLLETVLAGKPKSPVVTRTIAALLHENNLEITPDQVNGAIEALKRGENVASQIEARLQEGMVKKLNLNALVEGAGKVKVTDRGYAEVTGSLAQFFSLGANSGTVDKNILKGMLIAVLEDRYSGYRFTTPPAAKQLEVLDAEQMRAWLKDEVMTHVRFDANGKAEFDKRVKSAAGIAGGMLANMTASWGELDALKAKQKDIAERLRKIDKNDRAARIPVQREIQAIPAQIAAMEWAKELASMTPETTTPLRFAEMGKMLTGLGRALGPAFGAAINELSWTVRIDDLSYSQVVTNDGPDLSTMYRLATAQCLRGWPNDVALLAYCVDANKRMIVTKNQAGEERRSMMRIVTRNDEGHQGEPMLVLERSYPDTLSEEEKQRLVEHMLRRAVDMGIAAAYPTEYYWDASKTARKLLDMNAVLEDLNRRYNTTSEIKVASVTSRAGNINPEYIDSAPLGGVGNAGVVGIRRYNGQQDNTYENRFLILSPKKD